MIRVTVLGCGASGGVPIIGCDCAVCRSDDPRNTRTRASIFIETQGLRLLVDTSPDLRAQALRENITQLDAILYTHTHADHLHGVDDVRSFNYAKNGPMDIHGSQMTLDFIAAHFPYVMMPPQRPSFSSDWGWYRPCLAPNPVTPLVPFSIGGMEILPFEQTHGRGLSMGFRIGAFAYSTDANLLSEDAFQALAGVDTWIVDCLRYAPAPTHSHLEQTLEWIARVKPRRAYLTHLSHDCDYATLSAQLPEGVFVAHDGLVVELP